jgi:hypothetical protein
MHVRTTSKTILLAATAVTVGLALTACNPTGSRTGGSSPTSTPSSTAAQASPSAAQDTAAGGSGNTNADSGNNSSSCTVPMRTALSEIYDDVRKTFIQKVLEKDPSTQPDIQPDTEAFLFGQCGNTYYVVTKFTAGDNPTTEEGTEIQDDGATAKYFSSQGNSGVWKLIGSQGFPPSRGCINAVPADLAKAWTNCSAVN